MHLQRKSSAYAPPFKVHIAVQPAQMVCKPILPPPTYSFFPPLISTCRV